MSLIQFSKTKTQLFLEKSLSQNELVGLSQSITNAYSAVDAFYKSTPALGAFMVGGDLRSHLLRVFVEYSLQKYADVNAGFTHEVRPNVANNCNHLRLYKNDLALTSHYMGAKCERLEARSALHKANLVERNGNLFELEESDADIFRNIGYAQIMHGGISKPLNILINIPSRDQLTIIGTMQLAIVTENKTQVEKIIDEMPFKLNDTIKELKNGNKKIS